MYSGQVAEAVAHLRAGVDALLTTNLSSLGEDDVAALLVDVETERRRLESVDTRFVREVDERWSSGAYRQTGTIGLLTQSLRVHPREARRRLNRADELAPRRTLSGEPLAPLLPLAGGALAAGDISAEHVDVICDVVRKIRRIPRLDPAVQGIAEEFLVDAAHHETPKVLAYLGRQLLCRLDPDGPEPAEEEQARRDFTLHKRPDGSSTGRFDFTAEATAALEAAVGPLAAPHKDDSGLPDQRTPGQRWHDGVHEVMCRVLRSGELPDSGGRPVTLLVRIDWHDYLANLVAVRGDVPGFCGPVHPDAHSVVSDAVEAARRDAPEQDAARAGSPAWSCSAAGRLPADSPGIALTESGAILSLSRLMFDLCEAEIKTVVTNDTGGVLAFGDAKRYATPAQRLALATRDGGCSFPGCLRPASWCEAHHIIPWQFGGPTDLTNLCLLCRFHHSQFEKRGWAVVMTDGVPEWIPPPWLDPAQKPRRNTAHHPPDFDFAR